MSAFLSFALVVLTARIVGVLGEAHQRIERLHCGSGDQIMGELTPTFGDLTAHGKQN
jgi:hypothetical protein